MDYQPILEKLYPTDSIGGQCGIFCHRLVQFPPIGNTLQSKIESVRKFGILAKFLNGEFHAGDIIITDESRIYGHVAFVNELIYEANTAVLLNLQLTESNFNLDLRVHHNRLLNPNSDVIIGVIRGPILFPIPQSNGQ